MITLDTDLSLISRLFNISVRRMSEYTGKSLDEIMETEAARGNLLAANFDREVLSDPSKLIKLFKLFEPSNRYAILTNMNERDLNEILPLLEKEDMVFGLNFFTKEQLLGLYEKIPKNELVKLTFQLFPPQKVVELMPEKEINKMLTSDELDKDLVLKHLKSVPPAYLALMLEAATGKPAESMNQNDLVNEIAILSPEKYNEALVGMPLNQKKAFVFNMTKEQPKLFELFSAESYVKLLNRKEKPDLVKSAIVIEPKSLMKMLGKLPKDLLSVVMTQIDPKVFADVLISKYQEVLKNVVAA